MNCQMPTKSHSKHFEHRLQAIFIQRNRHNSLNSNDMHGGKGQNVFHIGSSAVCIEKREIRVSNRPLCDDSTILHDH